MSTFWCLIVLFKVQICCKDTTVCCTWVSKTQNSSQLMLKTTKNPQQNHQYYPLKNKNCWPTLYLPLPMFACEYELRDNLFCYLYKRGKLCPKRNRVAFVFAIRFFFFNCILVKLKHVWLL